MPDMLINDEMFSFVDKNKYSKSRELYLAFPVVAYKIEITSRVADGNPIRNAVKRLFAYYHSPEYIKSLNELDDNKAREQTRKPIPLKIAEDLDLSEELVKRIIEREELKKEQSLPRTETEEHNEEGGVKKVVNAYAVFDMLSKQFLPYIVEEREFDNMKREVEDPHKYRASLGDSDFRNIICLRANDDNYSMQGPSQALMESLLRRKHGGLEKCKLSVPGYGERFLLTTCCFYAKNNPYSFYAMNPFGQEPAQWMRQFVQEWTERNAGYGKYVSERLSEIKPNAQSDIEPKNKTERDLDEKFKKCASSAKGNDETVSQLLPRFKTLFLSYVTLWQAQEEPNEGSGGIFDGEKRAVYEVLAVQNYLIALYTFFEEAFRISAIKYNRFTEKEKYYKNVDNLYGDDGNGELLYELAAEVGFADTAEILKKERFKREDVLRLIEGQLIGEQFTVPFSASVYLNLLEASFDEGHPFRKLCALYPNLLTLAVQTRKPRNKAKHGNVYDLGENYQDFYHIATDVFQTVCNIDDEQFKKYPQPKDFVGINELSEDFDRAYAAAKCEIEKFTDIKDNDDLRVQATFECLAFEGHEGEFLAKIYNLYDEVLTQLIRGYTFGGRIDGELVKRQLNGKSVFARAMEILQSSRVYPAGNALDKNHFRRSWILQDPRKLENISVRNKLLYYVFCVNGIIPRLYRDEAFRKCLFELCEGVSETSEARGHNEQADFKANEKVYRDMHLRALNLCNELCRYIRK